MDCSYTALEFAMQAHHHSFLLGSVNHDDVLRTASAFKAFLSDSSNPPSAAAPPPPDPSKHEPVGIDVRNNGQ